MTSDFPIRQKRTQTILSEYETKETIGKGTFSTVKLGIKKSTRERVAIKILEKSKIINKDDLQRVQIRKVKMKMMIAEMKTKRQKMEWKV